MVTAPPATSAIRPPAQPSRDTAKGRPSVGTEATAAVMWQPAHAPELSNDSKVSSEAVQHGKPHALATKVRVLEMTVAP